MMESTLAIIKPDAIEQKVVGEIIDKIESRGFQITEMKMTHLSENDARKFYFVHRKQEWFPSWIKFMASGSSIILVLTKENAIEDWRELMKLIRWLWGTAINRNLVHGSDSEQTAKEEIEFFFPSNLEECINITE